MAVIVRVLLLMLLWGAHAPSIAADVLRIHGSNTIGEKLAPALAEAWLRQRGCTTIEHVVAAPDEQRVRGVGGTGCLDVALSAHGSSTGFADLFAGDADLAMSSRPVSAAEIARGASLGPLDSPQQEAVLALDGVAVIVHPDNPLRKITLTQLRQVFDGSVRDWRQLGATPGAITIHARDANSGTWETFRNLVLGDASLRGDASRYESTRQLSLAVAADPRAIGFVGLAGVGTTRALAIAEAGEPLPPTPFSVAVEDYPLARRLYLYRATAAPALAEAFVRYALSPQGQQVVDASGFVAQQVRAWHGDLRRDVPEEYRTLVEDAERLSLNFRFGTGSGLLDSKALHDLDRLATFLKEPGNRTRSLLLLGFADASETVPYLALTLSNDRADFIAARLAERDVPVQRVRGMGGRAPVASNDSATGRQRNRRVEVWLGPAETAAGGAGRLARARR